MKPQFLGKRLPHIECSGKTYYDSKKSAQTAMNSRLKGRKARRHGRPESLRAYPCPKCHGWHLTSQTEDED